MITSFVWAVRYSRAVVLGVCLLFVAAPAPAAAQSQSYAPVVFWNVPNYYSGGWGEIRYPDPTSAFTVEWDAKTTQQCGTSILFAYREIFISAVPVDVQGYPVGSIYQAERERRWCEDDSLASSGVGGDDARRWVGCADGGPWQYSPDGLTCAISSNAADPEQNRSAPSCPDCSYGDPINASVGNKYEEKHEFVGNGAFPLLLSWTYNSSGVSFGATESEKGFGRNRAGHYGRSVRSYSNGVITTAYLTRSDGNLIRFNQEGATWIGPPDSNGKLISTGSGWEYRTSDGSVELYNSAGQLISLINREGFTQALVYDTKFRLQSVTDPEGRKLTLIYNNPQGTIKTATLPDGSQIQFEYDADSNLRKVSYPGGSFIEYRYNETGYVATSTRKGALTGVIDETQQRYSSTSYDANTYATSTYLAGNVDRFDVAYSSLANGYAGQAAVTFPSGRVRTVIYAAKHGKTHPNSYSEQCAGCTTATESYTFDVNGRLDTTTDKRGVIRDLDWNSDGRVIQRVDAANDTAGTKRTTQTDWHATFAVPTERRTYDANGILVSKEVWTYNSRGQVLSHSLIGL